MAAPSIVDGWGASGKVCAALIDTPLAQAVSKLTLDCWSIEPPVAALRASFPNVLHFELYECPQSMASTCEAITAWPLLRSISLKSKAWCEQAVQQHLEAAARTAAEHKAGQPFTILLRVHVLREGDAGILDAQVAAIRSAGGGKVTVPWELIRVW